MNRKEVVKRKDLLLRKKYESGEINADEFLEKLFESTEADRKRRRIVEKNQRAIRHLQRA